jgi:hypothetical protein
VGEAAVALDPLSSQGIQAALRSALQAAVVINTWLRHPPGRAAANTFYRDNHREAILRSERDAHKAYQDAARRFGSAFWRCRCTLQDAPEVEFDERPRTAFPPLSSQLRLEIGVRVVTTAVIRDDIAEFAQAVVLADSARPVAFVGGLPVGELAHRIGLGNTGIDLVRAWSNVMSERSALKVLAWMWQAGVIAVDPQPIVSSRKRLHAR